MPPYVRSPDEVKNALREQIMMMRASAEGYDNGNRWEAKRLAVSAYTLLHDGTGRTKSILTQLGARAGMRFVSTAMDINGLIPANALVAMQSKAGQPFEYAPYLDISNELEWTHRLQFQNWWDETIFQTVRGQTLSRKNLVFALRSQDNGGHFDAELPDNAYYPFATVNDERVTATFAGNSGPIPDAHLATMRQIAWEILETLKEAGLAPL